MLDIEQTKEIINAIMEYWNRNPHLTINDIIDIIEQAFKTA